MYRQYSFNGTPADQNDPNSKAFIRASDVRAQQASIPEKKPRKHRYPSRFNNKEQLTLSSSGDEKGKYQHHPIIPGQQKAYVDGSPGAVRSVYTRGEPEIHDVMYHDPTRPPAPSGQHPFTVANYHPRKEDRNDHSKTENVSLWVQEEKKRRRQRSYSDGGR